MYAHIKFLLYKIYVLYNIKQKQGRQEMMAKHFSQEFYLKINLHNIKQTKNIDLTIKL